MMTTSLQKTLVCLFLLLAVSCVTVNIRVEFPAAEVEEAAEMIENEVRGVDETTAPSTDSSWIPLRIEVGARTAYAAEPDLNIQTPEIRRIVERRKARWPKIDDLLTKGFVGEALDGTLQEVDPKALPLREAAEARGLVREENGDRQALYVEIAKANNLETSQVPKVAAKFAEVNIRKLKSGQYYQQKTSSGVEWVKK